MGIEDTYDKFKEIVKRGSRQVSCQSRESTPSEEQCTGSLKAEMDTMAQRCGSMDDSFHLPNFPHMAWVGMSALSTIVIMPSL